MRRKLRPVKNHTYVDARTGMCFWKTSLSGKLYNKVTYRDWSINRKIPWAYRDWSINRKIPWAIAAACRNDKIGTGYIKVNTRPIIT